MTTLTEAIWIEACAHCLHRHWRTVNAVQLEDVARELWSSEHLRTISPAQAVEQWLKPITQTHQFSESLGSARSPESGQRPQRIP